MPRELPSKRANASGLTSKQLKELRARLVQARAETFAQLRDEEETARSAESLPEPMDAAELSREQGDAAFLVERTRARLREIDDALSKLDAGSYGVSERSGDAIGFDRLKAVPWARLAVDEE
jgi:DnaK suppressor protein